MTMKKTKSGFSLIELMVVIFIIGMLVGWVVPNFTGFLKKMKLENSSRMAVVIMRNAARHAVSDRREVRLTVKDYNDATPKNSILAQINGDIRLNTDDWSDLPSGYCEMIPPVSIEWTHTSLNAVSFTMFGVTSGGGGYICMTYLLPGEESKTGNPHQAGVKPLGISEEAIDHHSIWYTGLQKVTLFRFLRGSSS